MGRVNQSTLWWFDYVERIEEGKLIIMVYRAEVDGVRRRGKPKKKMNGWALVTCGAKGF